MMAMTAYKSHYEYCNTREAYKTKFLANYISLTCKNAMGWCKYYERIKLIVQLRNARGSAAQSGNCALEQL